MADERFSIDSIPVVVDEALPEHTFVLGRPPSIEMELKMSSIPCYFVGGTEHGKKLEGEVEYDSTGAIKAGQSRYRFVTVDPIGQFLVEDGLAGIFHRSNPTVLAMANQIIELEELRGKINIDHRTVKHFPEAFGVLADKMSELGVPEGDEILEVLQDNAQSDMDAYSKALSGGVMFAVHVGENYMARRHLERNEGGPGNHAVSFDPSE